MNDYGSINWERQPYNEAGTYCANPGDSIASITVKTDHCYDEGYGGVFAWELGQDAMLKDNNNTSELLLAIWDANEAKGGYPDVTITTQPVATTTVTQ